MCRSEVGVAFPKKSHNRLKNGIAEVFLGNFKGCEAFCARSLLDINDEAQKANPIKSGKKTTQLLIDSNLLAFKPFF